MTLIDEKLKLINDKLVEKQKSDSEFYDEIMDLVDDIKILLEAKTSAIDNEIKPNTICQICKNTGWYFAPNFGGGGKNLPCLCGLRNY